MSIPLVAGEMDPEWPKEPLTKEQSDELLQWMIAGAGRAYRHFADARRVFADRTVDEESDEDFGDDDYYPETYVRSEPKIGRNEPCPCGSGKKYKRCCGAG
jgi:preprotein translocase subunit SecA